MSIPRDLTLKIKDYLLKNEVLLIIGPRQAGKTTVLHQLEDIIESQNYSHFFLNLEDPDYLSLLNKSPKNLFNIFPLDLKEKIFVLIDEVQYLNNPTNFLKYFFDEYKGKIEIIATGSSAFYFDKKFKDSLVGRKIIFHLLPLSFKEFLRFKGEEDLSHKDLKNLTLSEQEKIMRFYPEYLIYGGYPRVVLSDQKEKIDILREIAYSYIKKDVFEAGIRQDEIFYKLFKLLANQVGNLVNSSELANTLDVSKTAINNYLYLMQKSFHLILIRPFFKNIRKELTKMPKIFFIDLGLRNFFKNDFRFLKERDDIGQLFENAIFRQLIEKYNKEEIKYWRTIQQKEIDFVIGENLAFGVKTQLKGIKIKDYQQFLDFYPQFKLSFVSLFVDKSQHKKIDSFSVLFPWEI